MKIDLKDVYFSILIDVHHRKFLCFQVEGKLFQFNCLPFGLASAPSFLYQDPKASYSSRSRAGDALGKEYIDDILLMVESKEKARDQTNCLIYNELPRVHSEQRESYHGTFTDPNQSKAVATGLASTSMAVPHFSSCSLFIHSILR